MLQVKIIDFGAAVDMCTGINFNPLFGMLDPRYSPPEELVMPQSERAGAGSPGQHAAPRAMHHASQHFHLAGSTEPCHHSLCLLMHMHGVKQ